MSSRELTEYRLLDWLDRKYLTLAQRTSPEVAAAAVWGSTADLGT